MPICHIFWDHWGSPPIHHDTTLDFANAFVSPGANNQAELVYSHGAPRRCLGDNSWGKDKGNHRLLGDKKSLRLIYINLALISQRHGAPFRAKILIPPGETKALAKSKMLSWWWTSSLISEIARIARRGISNISIFKDKYLENRFIYKSFETIFVWRNENY